MNIKNISKIILAGAALVIVSSCSKSLLNLTPADSISLNNAFEQVSDAQQWDNGMYAIMRVNVYGQVMMAPDIQVDLLNATLDYGNNYGSQQDWVDFSASDYAISGIWGGYYNALANIDEAIAGFQNIKPQSASDSATMNQCTGDAYLARAFYFLNLVLRWSVAYNPSTASTDLGIPLVLTYNINALPARATMAATYAQILSDIAQARTLLSAVPGTPGSNYFTQDAVLALEARTKLYMQDWAGAKSAADSLINSGTYPLINNQAAFTSYWTNDDPGETIFQIHAANPNEVPPANNMYINFNSATGANDPYYIPSQWVVDMFDNNDIRKGTYFLYSPTIIQGNAFNLYIVNKYPGNPSLFTGALSNYEQAPKVFRVAEMYLISAEAAAQAGNATAALTTLNTLRVNRGIAAITTGISADSLTNAIRDERFRELAFEGMRLDDLKRWNLGFTRSDPQNTNALTPGPNFYTLSQPAGADKFVWGLPTNDITINPNLKQNPGW